jgi:hypothetical protein
MCRAGRAAAQIVLAIRNPGDETGPGTVYPDGTNVMVEHAREAARKFWRTLAGRTSV